MGIIRLMFDAELYGQTPVNIVGLCFCQLKKRTGNLKNRLAGNKKSLCFKNKGFCYK